MTTEQQTCGKCGMLSSCHMVRYVNEQPDVWIAGAGRVPGKRVEYLAVKCCRCEYTWTTPCVDAPPKEAT